MRRRIRFSVMLPVTVEVLVHRQGSDEDWQIEAVTNASVDTPSPRAVYENADDETMLEIGRLANAAKELRL